MSLRASVAILVTFAGPASALALETEYVPEEVAAEDPDHASGWTHQLDLGAAIQIGGSHRVAGQTDGTTVTLSAQISYAGTMWRESHELRLTGSLSEALSRTPLIDDFVKSGDTLAVESLYFFHVPSAPWVGPYARASARTSLLAGVDVRPDEVVYLRDGETLSPRDRLQITNALAPTYLKQSAGVFARPLSATELTLDIRLGGGARETLADGSYLVDDASATPEIEVKALETYTQAGAEASLGGYGTASDGTITYGANFEMMTPFYSSLDSDLAALQATNYEIGGNFGARLSDWASIQYRIGFLRVPLVVEDWQISNSLLLSFGTSLTRTSTPAAE